MRFFFSSTVVALTTASLAMHYAHSAPVVGFPGSKTVAGKLESSTPSRFTSTPHRRSQDDDSNVNNTLSLQDQLSAAQSSLQSLVGDDIGFDEGLLQMIGALGILTSGPDQSQPIEISDDMNDFIASQAGSVINKVFQIEATIASYNQTVNALQEFFAGVGITVSDDDDGDDGGDAQDNGDNDQDGDDNNDN